MLQLLLRKTHRIRELHTRAEEPCTAQERVLDSDLKSKSGKVAKAGAAPEQTADNIVLIFPYRNRRQCGLGQAALPYGDLSAKFVIAEYPHQGVRVQRETAAETPALNREKDFRANVLNHGKLSETVSPLEILKAN